MSGWVDETWNKDKGVTSGNALVDGAKANSNAGSVKASDYFTGDNRLVYTANGPMTQRGALKSMYNGVAPASGWNYVEDEKYGDVFAKYKPDSMGLDWTGKAKGSREYVKNYFAANGMKAPTWDDGGVLGGNGFISPGINYNGVNTQGPQFQHMQPTTPVDWGAIADQTSYDPTATGKAINPVTGQAFLSAAPPPPPVAPPPPPPPPGDQTPPAVNPYLKDGKFVLPEGFDVTQGATGEWSPFANEQVYGKDYFPGNTSPAFNTFMASQGWTGAVPKNRAEFAALTPEQQGQYRTLLQRNHAASLVDVKQGSKDPAVNKLIYGADYLPAATNPDFATYLKASGFSGNNVPTTQAEFAQLTPEQQGEYRTYLAKWHKDLGDGKMYTPPPPPGPVGPPPPGTPPPPDPALPPPTDPLVAQPPPVPPVPDANGDQLPLLDWGQLGDYGFQFPLVPQFDPASIDKNPNFAYLKDKAMDEARTRLMATGRANSTFGNNVMGQTYNDLMSKQLELEYNRYLSDQQNARSWGQFGQGEDQRQFGNMLNLAQMGQQSAGQAAGYVNQFGQQSAQLFDEYGTYIGDQSNAYAKNQADTTRSFIGTQLGLDQANSGTLINMLMGYGADMQSILMWAADPTTQAALATAKANAQSGTGNAMSAVIASYFNSQNKKGE